MKTFTVHERQTGYHEEPDCVVVKEGFCWPAVVFTALWALYHRLWLFAVLIFVMGTALNVAMDLLGADPVARFLVTLGFILLIGFEANDWRRRRLRRLGYDLTDVVIAPDARLGMLRYLDRHPYFRAGTGLLEYRPAR